MFEIMQRDVSNFWLAKHKRYDATSRSLCWTRQGSTDPLSSARTISAAYFRFRAKDLFAKRRQDEENLPETQSEPKMIQMKNLRKELRFNTDGNDFSDTINCVLRGSLILYSRNHWRHFDFGDMTWKSHGQPILDVEWMNIKDVHVNYPILNDRIAYSRGTVEHPSKSL